MADRKPLVVLGVLVVAAILLYLLGVLGPGGGSGGSWPDWASPDRAAGDPLTAADLDGGPGCDVDGTTIAFTGTCAVAVREVTGGFGRERATRRAILTTGSQPVGLTVTLAGRTLSHELDPGEDVRLTYTREGGTFVLQCGSATGCAVVLRKDA